MIRENGMNYYGPPLQPIQSPHSNNDIMKYDTASMEESSSDFPPYANTEGGPLLRGEIGSLCLRVCFASEVDSPVPVFDASATKMAGVVARTTTYFC
jgi:hypothetical protein